MTAILLLSGGQQESGKINSEDIIVLLEINAAIESLFISNTMSRCFN